MKKRITAIAAALACFLVLSCGSGGLFGGDEDEPAANEFSLKAYVLAPEALPDTIAYGDSAVFSISVFDSAGDSVNVTAEGLPPGIQATTQQTTDETVLSFTLKGNRLQADSLYHIIISAGGSGEKDTLTQVYDVFIKGPGDFSLTTEVLSAVTIPDTLYYGDTAKFSIRISDSGGDSVDISVTGLPPAVAVQEEMSPDGTILSFILHSGGLTPDSLYDISISAQGSGTGDTLTLGYSVLARAQDVHSLWTEVVSVDSKIPDTLHAGMTITYIMKIGDSDGDPVSVTVEGLPPGVNMEISDGQDTAVMSLILFGDSLPYDSLYNISIHADGSFGLHASGLDTLTIARSMLVLDTNRLGGLRRLAVGMWWTDTQMDTISSTKVFHPVDSTNISIKYIEHHKYSEVINLVELNGWLHYQVLTYDTLINLDSIATNMFWVRHTDSLVDQLMPGWLGDTLRVTMFKLPLFVGSSWESLAYSWDTAVSLEVESS